MPLLSRSLNDGFTTAWVGELVEVADVLDNTAMVKDCVVMVLASIAVDEPAAATDEDAAAADEFEQTGLLIVNVISSRISSISYPVPLFPSVRAEHATVKFNLSDSELGTYVTFLGT